VTTATGYATWRVLSYLPGLLGFWTVLAGARLVRGDEERGALAVALSTPLSRTRVLGQRLATFVAALVRIGVLIGLGAIAGEARSRVPVDASPVVPGRAAQSTAQAAGMAGIPLGLLLTDGPRWGPWLVMAALALAGLALSTVLFAGADVRRGH
jgi:hypothetical protein